MIKETSFTVVGEWKHRASIVPVSFQGAVSWSFLFVISISAIYARGMENPALCLASVMLLSELLGVRLPDRSAAPAKWTPPIC